MSSARLLGLTPRKARHLGGRGEDAEMNRHFEGAVYLPGDDGYEAHRRPLRADLDPHPAIVIEALSASDIRIAIAAARERQMPFAVQATGHGTHVACDGGILVKTSAMTRVLVDPDRRIARVGPGTRWSDVLAAATPFGLAPLSGSSPSEIGRAHV